MNIDDLKKKYGGKKIMVIHNNRLKKIINIDDFKNAFLDKSKVHFKINSFNENTEYIYRYDAEINESYKQPIPYVLFLNHKNEIFTMKRISGDDRLIGMYSLGIGGHVDDNEIIEYSLYREIYEEVGLTKDQINSLEFIGLILDTTTPVGKYHIGFLFIAKVNIEKLSCIENDILSGEFLSIDKVLEIKKRKLFETWSEIAIRECLEKQKLE